MHQRSFVPNAPGDTAVVQSLTSFASHLNLRVVAEVWKPAPGSTS